MKYLIAVLPDRLSAEGAYTALEQADDIEYKKISIVGKGYKTADEFGFIDPKKQAKKRALLMATWLVPFGFAGGYIFDLITGLDTFKWAGEPWNHVIGGILGAIGGAMGSVFVGGGVSLTTGSKDTLPYRKRLNEGKYLLVVESVADISSQAIKLIREYKPESIQVYDDYELGMTRN